MSCEIDSKLTRNFIYDNLHYAVEPENRMGFFTTPMILQDAYKKHYRTGCSSIFTANEEFSPAYLGIVMNAPLRDVVTPKASAILESGIFSHILKSVYLDSFLMKPEEIGPQVLTLQHLSAGFILIFGMLAVSIAVFVAECSSMLLMKLRKLFQMCLASLREVDKNEHDAVNAAQVQESTGPSIDHLKTPENKAQCT
jgi:hypothetical protein